MRVWYQSFIDPERHRPYFDRLRAYLDSIAGPGTTYEVGGLDPPDTALHRLTEFRCAAQALERALAAQEDGVDAVLLGHFQDSGLWELRSALEIPVVGLGEASMLYACQLGRKFGLVTIDPVFVPFHWEQVERYGLGGRTAGIVAAATPVEELVRAFADEETYSRVTAAFAEEAAPLVEAGAEVILPAGGLFSLLTAREHRFRIAGAAVLNPVAVAAKLTEVAVALRELNGTEPCRSGLFALPPAQAVDEFRDLLRR